MRSCHRRKRHANTSSYSLTGPVVTPALSQAMFVKSSFEKMVRMTTMKYCAGAVRVTKVKHCARAVRMTKMKHCHSARCRSRHTESSHPQVGRLQCPARRASASNGLLSCSCLHFHKRPMVAVSSVHTRMYLSLEKMRCHKYCSARVGRRGVKRKAQETGTEEPMHHTKKTGLM